MPKKKKLLPSKDLDPKGAAKPSKPIPRSDRRDGAREK